jgi:ferredoxin
MRIKVNRERCEANRICVELAPELFSVDAEDELHVLSEEVDERHREVALEAVRLCPRNALSVEE